TTPSTVTVCPLSGVVAPVPWTSAMVWVTSAARAGVAVRVQSPRAAMAAVATAARRRDACRPVFCGCDMSRGAPLFEVDSVAGCPPFGGQLIPTPVSGLAQGCAHPRHVLFTRAHLRSRRDAARGGRNDTGAGVVSPAPVSRLQPRHVLRAARCSIGGGPGRTRVLS